jgi:hypothetical protein
MVISIANFAFFAFAGFAFSIPTGIPTNLFTCSSVFANSIPFAYTSTQ